MKLTLLGHDGESLALVEWAIVEGGHELVAAYDVGRAVADVRALAPAVRLGESWEALVLGSVADAVIVGRGGAGLAAQTGISDGERRAEQLRKLAQAAVPMIVVCPELPITANSTWSAIYSTRALIPIGSGSQQ